MSDQGRGPIRDVAAGDPGPIRVESFVLRFGDEEPGFIGLDYCRAAGARGVHVASWTMTSSGESGVSLARLVSAIGSRMAEIPDGWRTTRLEVVVDPGGQVAWAVLEWEQEPERGGVSIN